MTYPLLDLLVLFLGLGSSGFVPLLGRGILLLPLLRSSLRSLSLLLPLLPLLVPRVLPPLRLPRLRLLLLLLLRFLVDPP